MDPEQQKLKNAFQIEGHYANHFEVGYNAFEFLLDFSQFYFDDEKVQLHTRIITSPAYVKALLEILQESIRRYEQTFGAIPREN